MTNEEIRRYRNYARSQLEQQPKRGLAAVEPLKPNFYQAKTAQEPIEKQQAVPQQEKGRIFSGPPHSNERSFAHVELVNGKFNAAANDDAKPQQVEGRNSTMVEKDKTSLEMRPPPEIAQAPDRKKHNSELNKEREDVAKFEADKARAIEKQQRIEALGQRPNQSKGMRM